MFHFLVFTAGQLVRIGIWIKYQAIVFNVCCLLVFMFSFLFSFWFCLLLYNTGLSVMKTENTNTNTNDQTYIVGNQKLIKEMSITLQSSPIPTQYQMLSDLFHHSCNVCELFIFIFVFVKNIQMHE